MDKEGYFVADKDELEWEEKKEGEKVGEEKGVIEQLADGVRRLVDLGLFFSLFFFSPFLITPSFSLPCPFSPLSKKKKIKNKGWPASYICMYDESWALAAQLKETMSFVSGGYC